MNKTGVIYGINGPVIYLKGNTGFEMSEMADESHGRSVHMLLPTQGKISGKHIHRYSAADLYNPTIYDEKSYPSDIR